MGLQNIKIKDIKITENHRVNIKDTHISELMQSIKQHGVMQPIGIARDGKSKYILRFGQRRLIACEKLGYKTIPAMVDNAIEEEKLLLENLTENMQREDPKYSELGRVIDKLRRKGLTVNEITARLGVGRNKIQEVMNVYDLLPEKYKKKVVFVRKGTRRQPGTIPALTANKLVIMKKQHGLNDKQLDDLFKATEKDGLDRKDLNNVGELINKGVTVEDALKNMQEYAIHSVDVVAKHTEIAKLMDEYGIVNRQHLFKKIIYGELPPLKKPKFIFTGICMHKEEEPKKKISTKKYKEMFKELIHFNLDENQQAAVQSLENITAKEWTEEQCQQIEDMYKEGTQHVKAV